MTVWEKTLVNLQRGHEKLMTFAAALSERMKAEVNIIRLRMQIDEVRGRISEHHRFIGNKLLDLRKHDALPQSFDHFFKSEEISVALDKISRRERELENLIEELQGEQAALKVAPPAKEEHSA